MKLPLLVWYWLLGRVRSNPRTLNLQANQMAYATLLPEIPSSSHCCSRFFSPLCYDYWHRRSYIGATAFLSIPSVVECSRSSICCAIPSFRRCGDGDCNHHHIRHRFIARKWRLNATTLRVFDAPVNGHPSKLAGIEIPVTCYQVFFSWLPFFLLAGECMLLSLFGFKLLVY